MTERSIWSELTPEQYVLLSCLYEQWRPAGTWPTVQDVDRWFRHNDMPNQRARTVMESFPVVGTRKGHGPSYSAIWYDPNQHGSDAVVRMTFAAGLHLAEFGVLVESYLKLLERCARAVREASPGSGPVTVDEKIAQRIIPHRRHGLIPTVPDMFQFEPIHFGTKTWAGDDAWLIELSDDIFEYADTQSVRDYIKKTVEFVERENKEAEASAVLAATSVERQGPVYVTPALMDELAAVEQGALHTANCSICCVS